MSSFTDHKSLDLPPVVERAQMGTHVQSHGNKRSFASMRTIGALILREMSTRYGRTVGGYVWAVLEPIAAVMMMAIGFSLILQTPPLGTNFLLFYASGYLPFALYQQIANVVARSISYSRPLLFYPAVTWIDAVLARFVLNALTSILVSIIIFSLIAITLDTRTTFDVIPLVLATGMTLILGFGVGVVNCTLSGLYPIWELAWSIITRPLLLASGILFTYESMPAGVQNVLWYNPLLHIIGIFRSGIYPLYTPDYVSGAFVFGSGLVLTTLGLLSVRQFYRKILENG